MRDSMLKGCKAESLKPDLRSFKIMQVWLIFDPYFLLFYPPIHTLFLAYFSIYGNLLFDNNILFLSAL